MEKADRPANKRAKNKPADKVCESTILDASTKSEDSRIKMIEATMQHLLQVYSLPYVVLDNHKNVLCSSGIHEERSAGSNTGTGNFIDLCFRDRDSYVMVLTLKVALAGIYVKENDCLILIGKLFLGTKASREAIEQEINVKYASSNGKTRIIDYIMSLPVYNSLEFKRLIDFIHLQINNEPFKQTNIIEVIDHSLLNSAPDKEEYYYSSSLSVSSNFSDYIFKCIQSGSDEKLMTFINENYGDSNRGKAFYQPTVRANLRAQKNLFISACILSCNAAIDGGLNDITAYKLYDYYVNVVEEYGAIEQVDALFNRMFLDFARHVKKISSLSFRNIHIVRCMNYIDEHLHQSVSIAQIAKECRISNNYLLRIFKKETGISLVDYINNLKIGEAKTLLLYSDWTISEISHLMGYSTQAYFTQIFKKVTGTTPAQYIQGNHKNR